MIGKSSFVYKVIQVYFMLEVFSIQLAIAMVSLLEDNVLFCQRGLRGWMYVASIFAPYLCRGNFEMLRDELTFEAVYTS